MTEREKENIGIIVAFTIPIVIVLIFIVLGQEYGFIRQLGESRMTVEDKDRIRRAEEIQLYTENRCQALEKENAELKELIEKMKKSCLDVMNIQGNNLSDDYMAGMYNGMVVIYNSCFLDTANELEKSYCSKYKNGKWGLEE